jgi:preprotein translocase subunit YajC
LFSQAGLAGVQMSSMSFFFFTPVAFQGASVPGASQWLGMVPMIAIFAIFYFLLVVPMRKRQKNLQALLDNLKKGDMVVTTGGLLGEIAAINDGVVILKVTDTVKLRVAKSAIAGLEGDEGNTGGKSS